MVLAKTKAEKDKELAVSLFCSNMLIYDIYDTPLAEDTVKVEN
jgi:hypothetical protein